MGDHTLFVESDTDEQLIIDVPFQEKLHLSAIQIGAHPDDHAPSVIKLYINRPNLGFDEAESIEPTQTLDLSVDQVSGQGEIIPLRFVKFQRVTSIQVWKIIFNLI